MTRAAAEKLIRTFDEKQYRDIEDSSILLDYSQEVKRIMNWIHSQYPEAVKDMQTAYADLVTVETEFEKWLKFPSSTPASRATDFRHFCNDFRFALRRYIRYADNHRLW